MKIRIDNIEVEADKGQTVLEAARSAGMQIPTLCHSDGIENYSSCMVCMVKDNKKNTFIPSCTAIVQEEMDIDASGEEVLRLRKQAVTMLLSEHRAECEAQCRVVCPAGYNIPLMNRLLIEGEVADARELLLAETKGTELSCVTCKAYCENACRRKKIDTPVSIRNIRIFLYNSSDKPKEELVSSVYFRDTDIRKRFSSRTGVVDENEQREWLKECRPDVVRHREITDAISAISEAGSCMHCDCRAAENCSLRDLAEQFELRDPKGKLVNSPITKKINSKTGLIFENAKCIKCGLCVRLCRDSMDEVPLCFIDRGFVSKISEPLFEDFDNVLPSMTDKCIAICPTGALGHYEFISGK
jgi:ferredoxin